ncbi:MAG: hypothetical protein R2745_19730 [Vicinamibacterales bacterium]
MALLLRRVLGALGLDPAVFEDVERDRGATWQAFLVVLVAGIGAGIGNAGIGTGAAAPIAAIALGTLVVWVTWAALIFYLGTRALPEPTTSADLGEVLRTLGFAAAPGMFRAFEVFGGMRWLVLPATSLWMVAAMVVAIRQSLDYSSTTRAVQLAVLGWLVSFGVALVVGFLLARPVS